MGIVVPGVRCRRKHSRYHTVTESGWRVRVWISHQLEGPRFPVMVGVDMVVQWAVLEVLEVPLVDIPDIRTSSEGPRDGRTVGRLGCCPRRTGRMGLVGAGRVWRSFPIPQTSVAAIALRHGGSCRANPNVLSLPAISTMRNRSRKYGPRLAAHLGVGRMAQRWPLSSYKPRTGSFPVSHRADEPAPIPAVE